jgi:uncharacterized protein (TIGR02231 family)
MRFIDPLAGPGTRLPTLILISLACAGSASAAEVEARSRIDAVTVYPDAATIQRLAEVELPAGASTILYRGLPANIDPNSLRVEASAGARLSIGSVDSRLAPTTGRSGDSAIEAKLRSLRQEREGWQSTLDALEAKKAMILRYSQTGPEKVSPESKPLDISQWTAAWDVVGQGLAKIGDELRAARTRTRELDDDIRALEQTRQKPQLAATRDVLVQVESDAATKGDFKLSYRIAGAGWQPVYDARLDTGDMSAKPSLELVRRAAVTQRTGEDWSNVTLAVSTVRARRGTSAPDLVTQRLAFYEPPTPYAGAAPVPLPQALNRMAVESAPKAAAPAPRPAEEQQATIEAGAFQANFQIPGRIDVPGDGSTKTLRIATAKFTPDLTVKATPSVDETAYLQVKLTNAEEAPLLPGLVNLSRDGIFVGTGHLALVAPGDSTGLGFGADERVKVSRVPIRRKENEPTWYGQTKTEQREFRTSVKNLHPFKVQVNILDQIPISENSAIVVEQLPATTPPTDKAVNDKRGVLGWTLDLAPNESKDIRLAYRMKWPADRDVVQQPVPNGPRPMPR